MTEVNSKGLPIFDGFDCSGACIRNLGYLLADIVQLRQQIELCVLRVLEQLDDVADIAAVF